MGRILTFIGFFLIGIGLGLIAEGGITGAYTGKVSPGFCAGTSMVIVGFVVVYVSYRKPFSILNPM